MFFKQNDKMTLIGTYLALKRSADKTHDNSKQI